MNSDYLDRLKDKIDDKLKSMDSEELLIAIVETMQIADSEDFCDLAEDLRDRIINTYNRFSGLDCHKPSAFPDLAQALDIDYTEDDYNDELEQEQAEWEEEQRYLRALATGK